MKSNGFHSNLNISEEKKRELSKLADSKDGAAVKRMLDESGTNLQSAIERGDTDALQSFMTGLLQTEAGRNIVTRLSDYLK